MTASAKSLFRATKAKRASDQAPLLAVEEYRKPDARAALDALLAAERRKALEGAAALRDQIADEIGALPLSSIHSALCEYSNRIRAMIEEEAK